MRSYQTSESMHVYGTFDRPALHGSGKCSFASVGSKKCSRLTPQLSPSLPLSTSACSHTCAARACGSRSALCRRAHARVGELRRTSRRRAAAVERQQTVPPGARRSGCKARRARLVPRGRRCARQHASAATLLAAVGGERGALPAMARLPDLVRKNRDVEFCRTEKLE